MSGSVMLDHPYLGRRRFVPCSPRIWDCLSESDREIINFGRGFELAGEISWVERLTQKEAINDHRG